MSLNWQINWVFSNTCALLYIGIGKLWWIERFGG